MSSPTSFDLFRYPSRFRLNLRWSIASVVLFICLWVAVAWMLSGVETERRGRRLAEHERQEAQRSAEVVGLNLRRTIAHIRSIPAVIATDPFVLAALSRFGPSATALPFAFDERQRFWMADFEFNALSHHLADVVSIAEIGINSSWVMNAAGDTFAVGILSGDVNYLGANYVDRDYFTAAQRGENGDQFAVGRVTGKAGLYFTSPVQIKDQFLGAVGVRTNIDSLTHLLEPGMFVTDVRGVVIMAHDPNLVMCVMPNGRIKQTSNQERQDRYKRETFEILKLTPAMEVGIPDLIHWQDAATFSVMAVDNHPDDMLTINVIRGVVGIDTIRADRKFLALLLAVPGALLVLSIAGTVAYLRKNRRHSRDLAESLEMERRRVEGQRQFILMMSHEVGTPLAIIDRSAEMVMDLMGQVPEQVGRRLTAIRDSVSRLLRIIEGLLAAERAGLGGTEMIHLDAGEIVTDAVETLVLGEARIIVNAPIDGAPFHGDGTLMALVMTNLIDNAMKYSPADQPVEVDVLRHGDDEIVITVADRGIGFPDAELASAGQRFFRASNAGEKRGTGLGLHIVQRILAAHKGRLDISNRPGGGAVITVHLPQDN